MKFFKKIFPTILLFVFIGLSYAEDYSVERTIKASWYGKQFQGKRMANGKPFDMHDLSIVAHKSLPLGTVLNVKNPSNGKEKVVIVQDRGPYVRGRSLDVSYALAQYLGFSEQGHTLLEVTLLKLG